MISIIIVNYHVKKRLFECLQSIFASETNISYEVIVIDNDEQKTINPELKQKFPSVIYQPSLQNNGFGAGNNLGAKIAKGNYLFFLNPDTEIAPNTIDLLISFLETHKKVGITAPLLLDESKNIVIPQGAQELTPLRGIIAFSFFNTIFPHNPISYNYWLHGWNKKTLKMVDVVPGTAFMIRKSIFEKIGGFDEQFFLYFEENDMCKRVKKLRYTACIIPAAKVVHYLGRSTKLRADAENIFVKSRYLYYKKHFGIIPALIVRVFLALRKVHFLMAGIFFLLIFLRFYRINEMFIFSGEVGHNLLAIKNAYISQQIPLLGPPTSHPWLSFGPLFYWIYGPILILSQFNPMSHAYFGAFIGVLIVVANYYTIKEIYNQRVGLLSSFLITVSPLFIEFSRAGRFFAIVILLAYPFLLFLYRISNGNKKYLFWLGLIFGSMFSFHFSPLMLIPFAVLILIIKKVRLNKKDLLNVFMGFIIPMITFFLYDIMHSLSMTKNVVLWIPYRVAGFFGLYPKNTVSAKVLTENVVSFYEFLSKSFLIGDTTLFQIIFFLVLLFLILFSLKERGLKRLSYKTVFIMFWLLIGYAAVFIHGSPPIHYFVPIFSAPIIIVAILFDTYWKKKLYKYIILLAIALLMVINAKYFFSNQWFFISNNRLILQPYHLSYALQQEVAKTIVQDAKGEKYILHRIGPADQFEQDYAQNYIYLLWLYGNEPVQRAEMTYVIVEQPERISNKYIGATAFLHVANILIIKIPTVLIPRSDHLTILP